MKRFVALYDLHYGYERDVYRHKKATHDPRALSIALQFIEDFKPDVVILGGDMLDCAAISHHNRSRPGRIEGLRVISDAKELRGALLTPLEETKAELHYIVGNHEDWLEDLVDEQPGLEGVVDLRSILSLGDRWTVHKQGSYFNLGKLTFIHGDQLRGGEHVAKAAVIAYERSVRFGHFHTFQAFTKTSALDIQLGRSGVAIPCLCTRDPKYGEGSPNRWVQGFCYGYVQRDGTYADYVPIIMNGRTVVHGKVYKG